MSDPNELLAAMNALLAKATAPAGAGAAGAGAGWSQPSQPAAPALVQGVGVPVKIARGRGTLRLYLWLPAECASSPSALNAALDDLERAGIPLDTWEPKESSGGWSNNNRSGWRR